MEPEAAGGSGDAQQAESAGEWLEFTALEKATSLNEMGTSENLSPKAMAEREETVVAELRSCPRYRMELSLRGGTIRVRYSTYGKVQLPHTTELIEM